MKTALWCIAATGMVALNIGTGMEIIARVDSAGERLVLGGILLLVEAAVGAVIYMDIGDQHEDR